MKTLILLITAASVLCAEQRWVFFVNELKNWTEAQSYCRVNFKELFIMEKVEDMMELSSSVNLSSMVYQTLKHRVWLGLYENKNGWKWSLSDSNFYTSREAGYRNWSSGQPDDYQLKQFCVRLLSNGQWDDSGCSSMIQPVCADVKDHDATFVYVSTTMSWTAAQSYCREHHTDLASVRNPMENEKIKQLIPSGQSAWIGLYRDSWKWVDGTKPSITNWRTGEPNGLRENCAAASMEDGKWEDWDCTVSMPFFCYDVPGFQDAVRLKLVRSSSLDLEDPAVMDDLLKQLQQKLMDDGHTGDIQLKWKSQSDGKVFRRNG